MAGLCMRNILLRFEYLNISTLAVSSLESPLTSSDDCSEQAKLYFKSIYVLFWLYNKVEKYFTHLL